MTRPVNWGDSSGRPSSAFCGKQARIRSVESTLESLDGHTLRCGKVGPVFCLKTEVHAKLVACPCRIL